MVSSVIRRPLGQSALDLTPIGLGTWAIGGSDWIMGWGPQSDCDSIATIRRALGRDVNWIDTSPAYGLGRAETIVARALRYTPADEWPYVFTKAGVTWDDLGNVVSDLDPRSIERQVEGSLRRLGVETIDLVHLELAAADYPVFRRSSAVESAWEAMAALQQAGKVRFIGITNPEPNRLEALHQIAPITSVEVRYSLVRRDAEHDILPVAAMLGIGVIAASPMESGLLTGALTASRLRALPHNDWRRWSPNFQPAATARASRVVEELGAVAGRRSSVAGAIAVAWTLGQPDVTAVCVGARRPEQIDELIAADHIQLTTREAAALESAASDSLLPAAS